MKKLYFFLVTILVALAANASKVYFDNSDTNWSAVKAYVWGGTYSNNWPGEDMTLNQTTGLYEIEFKGTPGMIIFNNGAGTQTGDLSFVDGATYDKNGVKGAALNTYTVTFDNTKSGWSEVYAYYWGGGATNSWPGDKMTQGEGNLWTIEIKAASAPKNIIFNKGNDTGKTEDLKFEDGATYDKDGKVTGEPAEEVSYDGWYLKVPGDWNGWNQYDGGVEYNKMNNYNAFVTIDSYTGGFKVQIWNGKENLWYSNGQKLEPGEEYVLTGDNGGNMTLDSKYEGWLVYVNFDIKTMTLSVEVVEPIQGNYVYFDNTLAGFPNPMMLCLDETSQFCGGGLMEQCAPTPEWMQTQYVAMADGYKAWDYNTYKGVVPEQAVKVIFLDNDDFEDMLNPVGPFEPVAGHVYGMEGDLGTYEQAVTGVESIAAENAAPVYFNLQGQRVENPANGVFIRIANGKVAKVLVK